MAVFDSYFTRTVLSNKFVFQAQTKSFSRMVQSTKVISIPAQDMFSRTVRTTKVIFELQNEMFSRTVQAIKSVFQAQNKSFSRIVRVFRHLPTIFEISFDRVINIANTFSWFMILGFFLEKYVLVGKSFSFTRTLTKLLNRTLEINAIRKFRRFLGRFGYEVLNTRIPHDVEIYGGRLNRMVRIGNIFVLKIEPQNNLDIIFLDEEGNVVVIYKCPPKDLLVFRFRF